MPVARKARSSDPHDIERRLELIIHQHLADMEQNPEMFSAKDRLAAVQYIGMWINRKYGWGEPEAEGVGSAVRKYSGAFRITKPEAHAARPRAAGARSSPTHLVSPGFDSEDDESTAA